MKTIQINCQLSERAGKPKKYNVKKVCKHSEMPKNANYHDTIYIDNYCQDIYKTDNFVFYAKHPRY